MVQGIPKTGRFHFQLKIVIVTDEATISRLQQINGALEYFGSGWLQVLKSETLGPDWFKRSHRFLKNFYKFKFECNFQAPQKRQSVQISLFYQIRFAYFLISETIAPDWPKPDCRFSKKFRFFSLEIKWKKNDSITRNLKHILKNI